MSTHLSPCLKKCDKDMYLINIYHRLPKLGMSTHVFKISLCYDKIWEIMLCISGNMYHRFPELGISTDIFKISLCYP